MFIHTIKSAGLAQLSYLIGSEGQAAVVDPRRDCQVYIDQAHAAGCRITHIFETHRNEDLLSGAAVLSELTGATVYHGEHADGEVSYAETIQEGDLFQLAELRIKALATPGHTKDSISYVLYDSAFGEQAVGVLTGDTLFVGDVGRTDFYPQEKLQMAGMLYDSLQKLLSLGDQALIYPAHGAGSVCGDGMADREFSSVGYERQNNPMLLIKDRQQFIAKKLEESHPKPPYFSLIERLNLTGAEAMPRNMTPAPLDIITFKAHQQSATVVDVRGVTEFLGAHVPNSLAIPADMLSAYAGWLMGADDELLLVANDANQAKQAAVYLSRIGYDKVVGFLSSGLANWAADGQPFNTIKAVNVDEMVRRVSAQDSSWQLLDVRKKAEFEEQHIAGAQWVYLGELPNQLKKLDTNKPVTVMCESGARATVGASVLKAAGFNQVDVFFGAMGAWRKKHA